MAIIVEDGSIVENANSYVTTAELTAYATARGITLVADEEQLLIQAMDYIESLSYKGVKITQLQNLQWPRANVYFDGYYFYTDQIPQELKNGQMATAIAIDQGYNPLDTQTQNIKRKRVDVLEIEYMDGSSSSPIVKSISSSLWKLLQSAGNGGNVLNVNKG